MATGIPYDPRTASLFRPETDDNLFRIGPYDDEAALCAELSRAAYLGACPRLEAVLGLAGQTLEETFTRGSSFAFIARDPNTSTSTLVFRGTSGDLQDVVTDLRFLPRPWSPTGSVHRGFADALDAMWTEIEGKLTGTSEHIVITGHSLGAALATLAASRCPKARLYTFGSPLVGNQAFVDTLNAPHARYRNCADVVCRVPEKFPGFTHGGQLHYIDRWGAIHLNPSKQFLAEDQRTAKAHYLASIAWRTGMLPLRELADHAPVNYVTALLGRRQHTPRFA